MRGDSVVGNIGFPITKQLRLHARHKAGFVLVLRHVRYWHPAAVKKFQSSQTLSTAKKLVMVGS